MADVLFIHGLNSSKNSNKYTCLEGIDKDCIEFDYQNSKPTDVIEKLALRVGQGDIKVIVGHSFGGGIAMTLSAKFQLPCVVVNPSFDAANFKNGFRCDFNDFYLWTHKIQRGCISGDFPNPAFGIGLLEFGDEIVNQEDNAWIGKYLELKTWPDGHHRFSRLQELKDSVEYLLNTPLSRTDGC